MIHTWIVTYIVQQPNTWKRNEPILVFIRPSEVVTVNIFSSESRYFCNSSSPFFFAKSRIALRVMGLELNFPEAGVEVMVDLVRLIQ